MKIVYFCTSGTMSFHPLLRLAEGRDIVAIVRPAPGQSRLRGRAGIVARKLGLRQGDDIEQWARRHRVPSLRMTSSKDPTIVPALRRLSPDLICISTFRWILRREILATSRHGAINLHSALLPRHRGPIPLFWIYYHDDRETGVTVHLATPQADAGAILEQEAFPLPRAFPVEELNDENARRGAILLARAADAVASGTARPRPQDESLATSAPLFPPGARMVDFDTWGAERVWHFLGGLFPRYLEPLTDEGGRRVVYRGVGGVTAPSERRPAGSLTEHEGGWLLHCRDGAVRLAGPGEDLRTGVEGGA